MRAVDSFYYANDMLKIIGFFMGLLLLAEILRPKLKNERAIMQMQTTLLLFSGIIAFIGLGFCFATFILK